MEGDNVALLIDWENIKICATEKLNAPPDIILLKKVARKYGQLTVARAYANWADMFHEGDMERFSSQDIEPVFVHTRNVGGQNEEVIKGSADIRLACDCIEMLFKNPNILTYVLATGDGGFEHVVTKIKSYGKRAVIIGIRKATSPRLGVVSPEMVWYDDWISGLKTPSMMDQRVSEALVEFQRAVEDLRREKSNNGLQDIKERMKEKNPDFEEEDIGLPTFRHLAYLAEMNKLVRIDSTVSPAKAYLSTETRADEGARLHPGVKWQKLIQSLEPNIGYTWSSLKDIAKNKSIYREEKEIQEFLDNARRSHVLWFRRTRYHVSKADADEVRPARKYLIDLTNPKVQIYKTLQ